MEKSEFDKAIETFTKHLKEDSTSSVCYFGLALVYAGDDYASHDYFKAWDCYQNANKYFLKITTDETEFMKQFFTDSDARKRNKTIRFNYDTEGKLIEDKLIKYVREENNVSIAEHFLAVYPGSKYYENVVHIRNHIKFRLAEKANTLEAYRDFIKDYPDAAQIPKAINACNSLAFELAKKENTIASYTKFIKEYPSADQYFEALRNRDQLAFDDAKKKNTIESIEFFIDNYPKALQIMTARTILRKLLYDKAKEVNTLEAYNDFIAKYPDGEYFVDIFNLKSNVLGKKMSEHFEGAKEAIQWIKGFDFDEKNDEAGGIIATADGKTIVAGNRQKQDEEGSQSWLISIDNTGKVLWNKAFGSKTYNHSNQMSMTTKGEIVVTGWTGASKDTIARRAWIFKVAQNGSGIWEKNVEGNEVKDFALTPEGDMYLSGYLFDDSLRMKTFLLKLNTDVRKLWSRQYVKRGILNGIALNTKNELLCSAGRWIWRIDKQGYVLWEKMLPSSDSIYAPRIVNNQQWLCGTRNSLPLIVKLSDVGNTAGEFFTQTSLPAQTISCIGLPNKRFLTLEMLVNQVKVRILDEKGQEQKSILIPQAKISGPGAVYCSAAGEVYLTFTTLNEQNQGDIGVVKFNF
jgi:outer membrane protein assembly factor BamD (BamD/ComL family)